MLDIITEKEQKLFMRHEVLEASTEYFKGDELAASTWMNKYCLRNDQGSYLETTPDAMHKRMAKEFGRIEKDYQESKPEKAKGLSTYGKQRKPLTEGVIYKLFKNFNYLIPQGSVMALLGNQHAVGSLSNCVVVKAPLDSYGGIFYTDQQLAQLCKRRCGVGFDLSTIRPKGSSVQNAAGTSSGVTSFMERFSNTTREVSQNGRRGALMLTMDIQHPDVEEFITIKQDLKKVTGANISVRLTDDFMKAVAAGKDFKQQWPIDSKKPQFKRKVNATKLWQTIIQSAHKSAEPGIIFWDRQHKYSTSSIYPGFQNDSTNPCSEIAMQGGDSCRLMAMNLFSFVNNPFTSEATFDFETFYQTTYESQRLMDDLVTLELENVEKIIAKIQADPEPDDVKQTELSTWRMLKENGEKGRRTGLGFTALADTMAALNIKFDSTQSLETIDKIMAVKCEAEFESSVDMAIERGKFSVHDSKIEEQSEFIDHFKIKFPKLYERMAKHGRRNISISTVAPTGTVSMLAQTSSGIEPVFMLSYKRRRKLMEADHKKADFVDDMGDQWEEFDVYHPKLKQWIDMYPEKSEDENPYKGSTAPEIDWHKRIEIQAIIQKYVTHSISSTINLPASTEVDLVNKIYMKAWEKGLKGLTIYVDGSRAGVLIKQDDKKATTTSIAEHNPPKRAKEIEAKVVRFMNDNKPWMAFVGLIDGKPYEIFTGRAEDAFALPNFVDSGQIIKSRDVKKKSRYDFRYVDSQGYCVTIEGLSRSFNQEYWNYAKLISGIIRHGMPLIEVVHLIDNLHLDDDYINTWKNGVTRALKTFIPNGTKTKDHLCPNCGDEEGLIFEEGCLHCKSCGHSKCS
ncbi:MAG: adenosylcobalamin-dependent ribonucleoside-diphosphate reductase [Cytophagales bacterium]|nr:adenosylcobalamin-dependent ribonucleoside-diphosphate reductase [Cytophagales bacterium]